MPSGRCTDSTLITSAPIALNQAVANGPDQNAVKSSTETPANGRDPTEPGTPPPSERGSGTGSPVCSPRRGARVITRSCTVENRNGARGRRKPAPGCSTNACRSASCANDGRSCPFPTTAAGTRPAAHSSTTSSASRCVVQPRIISLTSCARRNRPSMVASSSSPARSSRPITCRSDSHCCFVTVVIPTYRPSPAGSLPGSITHRNVPPRPPGKRAMSVGTVTSVYCIASSIDTSTCSRSTVRLARHHAVTAPNAAKAPVTYWPSCPPTVSGGRCMCPWFESDPDRACSTSSGNECSESGPPRPNDEIDTVTGATPTMPSSSAWPGTKLSITTSAASTHARRRGSSSTTTLRCDVCRYRKSTPSGSPSLPTESVAE